MSWRMPAETEPQARVWMAFPTGDSHLADSPEAAARARTTWARVAHTIAEFEPVTMVVDPAGTEAARRYLDEKKVEIVEAPLDDAWMRDIGPTFVVDESGQLGAVDWVDYSYVNHLVVNGGVIGCAFGDPNDLRAKEILEAAYPGREVVMVPAKDVFSGGGIHCVTQQEPATGGRE